LIAEDRAGNVAHYESVLGARLRFSLIVLIAFLLLLIFGEANKAEAILRGQQAGGIARHVVRLVGPNFFCSATVIGPQEVLTAAHCAAHPRSLTVIAGGRRIGVTSANGGTPARLTLAHPLPSSYSPIATGAGGGAFIIAGYGVSYESLRAPSAGLRQAQLVSHGGSSSGPLIDPSRRGDIGASACLGDSGGPVAQFDGSQYVLVGIIDRASHPSPHRACGHLTHFVSVGGFGFAAGADANPAAAARPARKAATMRGQNPKRPITARDSFAPRDDR
jgi:hypothetical protein